jgi:hypothetical protein
MTAYAGAAYGASKAGVVLLTKLLASQYGSRGIRCNAVAPGFVLTPATADITPEATELVSRDYPMPRLCAPEDVANAVVFLASDEAGFINGTTLTVDGGIVYAGGMLRGTCLLAALTGIAGLILAAADFHPPQRIDLDTARDYRCRRDGSSCKRLVEDGEGVGGSQPVRNANRRLTSTSGVLRAIVPAILCAIRPSRRNQVQLAVAGAMCLAINRSRRVARSV